jgi:hypothetical protein
VRAAQRLGDGQRGRPLRRQPGRAQPLLGSDDPDGAGFSSRGGHTTFRANLSTRHAGAGIRLGGDGRTQGVRNNMIANTLTDNAGYGLKVMRRPQGRIAGTTFARNRRGRTNQMA